MEKKAESTLVIIIIILAFIGVVYFIMNMNPSIGLLPTNQTACTQEAKICPDGTSVGRQGPNCEFSPCPNSKNSSIYPNPNLTPGDILTTNSSIVCVSGYTATVRNVPLSERKQVFAEYNIPYPDKAEGIWEVDHFIPLELGGSNDIKNLFPESEPYYQLKDKVENYLHDQVCNHGMSLIEAQNQIKTDWYQVYIAMNRLPY